MLRVIAAVVCVLTLLPGDIALLAQQQTPAPVAGASESAKIPPDQLDSLVAPIALYPDPLLAQTLVASTYPLELIQLQQWLARNKDLKDKALADAVAKQPWDPSVQAMAALPDVVKRLTDDIQWATDLGNAFLAQQSEVMDAVQRMRKKAQGTGALKSNEQMKVETKTVDNTQVIIVEQASPTVITVPTYNPTVVYGAPAYPYPPIYYPPPPPAGYYAASLAISFGVGVMMGAAWSGGWGWNSGWGGNNDININTNNNFNRNTNIQGGNRNNINSGNRGNGSGKWQHNPQHRGGAPYSDRKTADKFGGNARGDSLSNRQSNGRNDKGNRGGVSDRSTGRGDSGAGDRAGNRSSGNSDRSSASTRDMSRGGADRAGNRDVSRGSSGRSGSSGFGGGGGGYSGSSARTSSNRGSSSMKSSGGRSGGGRSRGGGRRR
jgi:hypothetical protein